MATKSKKTSTTSGVDPTNFSGLGIKDFPTYQGGSQPNPIGVGPDFHVTRQRNLGWGIQSPSMTYEQGPRYFMNDEWGGDHVVGFPQDAVGKAQLQQQLIAAGLLFPKNKQGGVFVPGQWGTSSANAFAELLAEANQSGDDWANALSKRIDIVTKNGLLNANSSTRQRQPLVVKLTNPADIAATVNNVGKTLHGTYLSPEELAKFTAQYQQQESEFQTAAYQASGYDPSTGQQDPAQVDPNTGEMIQPAGAGGATLTAPPSVEAAANQAIRNTNPRQFEANTFTDRLDEILAGLRGNPNATQVGPSA